MMNEVFVTPLRETLVLPACYVIYGGIIPLNDLSAVDVLSGCSTADVTNVCSQETCFPGEYGYSCGERIGALEM